jgi:hypothetical protein
LQELQKLFELLLPKVHEKKHGMQFFPNFTEFACGAPLPLRKFAKRSQITFGVVSKCNGIRELNKTAIMSAIYRWENLI